eukprot:1471039-Rhodomonas_salina.1
MGNGAREKNRRKDGKGRKEELTKGGRGSRIEETLEQRRRWPEEAGGARPEEDIARNIDRVSSRTVCAGSWTAWCRSGSVWCTTGSVCAGSWTACGAVHGLCVVQYRECVGCGSWTACGVLQRECVVQFMDCV